MTSINGLSSILSNSSRVNGLVSGLDTDSLVKQMMKPDSTKLDGYMQKKQLAQWRQDDYRNIINTLKGFNNTYFDLVTSTTNMLSQSTYKKFTTTSSDSTVVTAAGTTAALPGSHTVTVNSLATAAAAASGGTVSAPLNGTPSSYALSGKKINVTLDGVTKELTLDNYIDINDAVGKAGTGLQALVNTAFGTGKIAVTNAAGKLQFDTAGGASRITLTSGSAPDGLASLGFTSGASNRIDTSKTLAALASGFATGLTFDASNNLVFTINSKTFTFASTTTLSSMMSTINTDTTANVNMSYDETTDKFKITAKQLGAGSNIKISQTGGNLFGATGASKIDIAPSYSGVDASAVIDGQTLTRSSNSFTVNGVAYNLLKQSAVQQTVTLAQDVDGIFNNIKSFVSKYNEVISTINSKLSEKYDRNYPPLTDDQKKAMSDTDIKAWEAKAKVGLLRDDSLLQSAVENMRRTLYDNVASAGANLSNIGITTGLYQSKGQLVIDETKLRSAIQNSPDKVMNLFASKSATYPEYSRTLTSSQRTIRYSEEGLAFRLYDIIQDNISTFRDSGGKKGSMVEKVGLVGDASEFSNVIFSQIKDFDTKIDALNDLMGQKANSYYAKFARLESVLSRMNSQSSWISSQLSK